MAAPVFYPPDYEARTEDLARAVLQDIPPCAAAEYRVRFIALVPFLILAFSLPGLQDQAACAVRLVSVSRSEPITGGSLLEGDRLRRHIRDSVEHYLHKHGIRIPSDFS